MADEQISVEVETFAPQQLDHEKKRKLVDLEADAPESVNDGDAMLDVNNKGNAEKEEENVADEAGGELKRPRLEKIEEENAEEAGVESALKQTPLEKIENGSTENGYEDNGGKVVEAEEEKVDKEPESLEDNVPKDTDALEQPQEPSAPDDIAQVADGDLQVQQAADNEQSSGQNEQNIENKSEAAKLEGVEPSSDINPNGDGLTAEHKPGPADDQSISRKIEVSNNKVGVLIGKAGDTIRYLQINSGAKIQIMRDSESDSQATTRPVELIGTLDCIERAEKLIKDVIAEADAGGSPALVARGFNSVQAVVGEQVEIQVPNEKVGMIIGKGGETIKNLQTRSGARIQLVPQHLPSGDQSKERTVRVTGDKKQIEMAREMIKEVMNQNVRHSSHSGGYNQHSHRPRGHGAPHWGYRNSHPSQVMGHDYQQRGPYQPQNQQYPPSYGNYPPQQAPRGNYGPGWEQRPANQGPPSQPNYNYGPPQVPDYVHQNPYPQAPAQSYGQGYNEMRYDNTVPPQQPYGGSGVPQPTGYHHGGAQAGYGPQDHYGRPSPYAMQQQQPAQGQTYGQPRSSQPGENPYQTPVSATQPYGSNVPPQQSYPYASSGPMQQTYPMYGSGPTTDGYTQPAPAATGGPVVYPQQGGQPVSGYGQPVVAQQQQQASGYAVGGPTAGYGVYPSQPGYAEQPAANNAAYGGYQQQQQQPTAADAAAYASAQGSTAYAAPTVAQPGYAQPAPTQPIYDQSVAQSGGYGTAAAPAGYVKGASPQPGYPPQYDTSQMYGAPR